MSGRVDLPGLYPIEDGEDAGQWTDRLLSHAKEHGTNRQCSLGWHGECSQRHLGAEAECRCTCHDPESRPGLISNLLTKCQGEVVEYEAEGPGLSERDQLVAAGRAELAQEIIDTIEGKAP